MPIPRGVVRCTCQPVPDPQVSAGETIVGKNFRYTVLRHAATAIKVVALALSAMVTAFAVSALEHPLVGIVGFLPLIFICQTETPLRAFLLGSVWGGSLCVSNLTLGSALVVHDLGTLLLLAVLPACYAALGACVTRRIGFSPFILALGWILVECCVGSRISGSLISQTDSGMLAVVGRHLGSAWSAFVVVYLGSWCLLLVSKWRAALARGYRGAGLTLNLDAFRAPASVAQPIAIPALSHPRAPPHRRAH